MATRLVEMSQMEDEDKNGGCSYNASADGKSKSKMEEPPIAYQCNGCEAFPIQGVRFTLGGGHGIGGLERLDKGRTCLALAALGDERVNLVVFLRVLLDEVLGHLRRREDAQRPEGLRTCRPQGDT